jgi:APA family basic amino acid/polyamine antiporter
VSCFGALNGWILLGGQVPLSIARDGLFPSVFGRTSSSRTPVPALVICGVLMTVMVVMNYSRGLVGMFTFIILLATLTTLVPYVFSSLALVKQSLGQRNDGAIPWLRHGVIAAIAFLYSILAIVGAGWEALLWGAVLLLAGIPVYVQLSRRRR